MPLKHKIHVKYGHWDGNVEMARVVTVLFEHWTCRFLFSISNTTSETLDAQLCFVATSKTSNEMFVGLFEHNLKLLYCFDRVLVFSKQLKFSLKFGLFVLKFRILPSHCPNNFCIYGTYKLPVRYPLDSTKTNVDLMTQVWYFKARVTITFQCWLFYWKKKNCR